MLSPGPHEDKNHGKDRSVTVLECAVGSANGFCWDSYFHGLIGVHG